MKSNPSYIRYTWFILVFIFLVILAGGVVRMTQSGMGCPDWPRCFGRWIPPTSVDQLPPDFEKYLRKQDIDHTFNVYHTWIEYVNRLLGALLGILILIHVIWSYRLFWKTGRRIFFISLFLLIAIGFQGWLGKRVVDGNLEVFKVTIHMLVALIIAALPVLIIHRLKQGEGEKFIDNRLKNLASLTIFLVIAQIVLGTEVREQIDVIARSLSFNQRELWINHLDSIFLLHRSFSWIILIASVGIFIWSRPHRQVRRSGALVFALTMLSVVLGLVMYLFDMPALAQPLHLLSGSVLAISLFAFRLQMK